MSASLDKEVAERFSELGMPLEAFPDHSYIVKFFECRYILFVRDIGGDTIDVHLLAPDYVGYNNRKIWYD